MKNSVIIFLMILCYRTLFAHPGHGIVQNKKGEVFYTDLSNVWKVAPDGKTKSVVVPNVHTHELSIDDQGNLVGEHLWYDDRSKNPWNHYVWTYTADGKFSKLIPDKVGFRENYSFVQDVHGTMYWIDAFKTESLLMQKRIHQKPEILYTLQTKDVRKLYLSSSGWLYYIDDNDLYKIHSKNPMDPVIIASDLDGYSGNDPKRKPNNNTMGIWDDAQANVYVAVLNKKQVKRITPNGNVQTIYKSKISWAPTGGLIDSQNNMWITEYNLLNQVRLIKVPASEIVQSTTTLHTIFRDPVAYLWTCVGLLIVFLLILLVHGYVAKTGYHII